MQNVSLSNIPVGKTSLKKDIYTTDVATKLPRKDMWLLN